MSDVLRPLAYAKGLGLSWGSIWSAVASEAFGGWGAVDVRRLADVDRALNRLRTLRDEYRDGAPLDIGAISSSLHVGNPPTGAELPPGTVSGPAEALAEYLSPFTAAGVGQVQVRFPARSATELCDQVAAFGAEVIPLVGS